LNDSETKDGQAAPTQPMSKEQRRELLAQIERASSRLSTPEATLEQGRSELAAGHLENARRLLEELEASSPQHEGLETFRRRLTDAEARAGHEGKRRTAEEMLLRFIQQRKKPAALLAFETLLEIEPDHPHQGDYRIWIDDLDEEVAFQKRIDDELEAGRAALQGDDLEGAHRRLEALRKLAPDAADTERFAHELEEVERGREEGAEVERHRQRFDELVSSFQLEEAEAELAKLSRSSVPKVTLDFLHKRLEEARGRVREASDFERYELIFREHLQAQRWQEARDLAHEVGERFRGDSRPAAMFDEVTRLEAQARRRQSLEQGIAALEGYIAQGQRSEAELALRVLQGLELGAERLAVYEEKISKL